MGISPSGGSLGITNAVNMAVNNLVSMAGFAKAKEELEKLKMKNQFLKEFKQTKQLQNEVEQVAPGLGGAIEQAQSQQAMPGATGGPGGSALGPGGLSLPTNVVDRGNQQQIRGLEKLAPAIQQQSGGDVGRLMKDMSKFQVTRDGFVGRLGKDFEPEFVPQSQIDEEMLDAQKAEQDLIRARRENDPAAEARHQAEIAREKAKIASDKTQKDRLVKQSDEAKNAASRLESSSRKLGRQISNYYKKAQELVGDIPILGDVAEPTEGLRGRAFGLSANVLESMGSLPEAKPIKGLIKETTLALTRIKAPGSRAGEALAKRLEETFPKLQGVPSEDLGQLKLTTEQAVADTLAAEVDEQTGDLKYSGEEVDALSSEIAYGVIADIVKSTQGDGIFGEEVMRRVFFEPQYQDRIDNLFDKEQKQVKDDPVLKSLQEQYGPGVTIEEIAQ